MNSDLLLHFHCHLYHFWPPSSFEDLSILSRVGNVGPTSINISWNLYPTPFLSFTAPFQTPVRHHLTLFCHPRQRGHQLLSACPVPSISEPDSPFYHDSTPIYTVGSIYQFCLIHADTCILLSPLSQYYVLIYTLFPYTNCNDRLPSRGPNGSPTSCPTMSCCPRPLSHN